MGCPFWRFLSVSSSTRKVCCAIASSAERYATKSFRGSSHRILASWLSELPSGAKVLDLGAGAANLARTCGRDDLWWVALHGDVSTLGALRTWCQSAAIVDLAAQPSG